MIFDDYDNDKIFSFEYFSSSVLGKPIIKANSILVGNWTSYKFKLKVLYRIITVEFSALFWFRGGEFDWLQK